MVEQKPQVPLINSTSLTEEEGDAITANVEDFYQQMRDAQSSEPPSGSISVDSAAFIMEAAYNLYAVQFGDYETESYNFKIQKDISEDQITMSDVTDAFWQIKDSIINFANGVTYTNKELASLDIEIDVASKVVFYLKIKIISGLPGSIPANISFMNPANHGWATFNGYLSPGLLTIPQYFNGQCDIDVTNKVIIANTENQTVKGAAYWLTKYGMWKYWGFTNLPSQTGYFVNVTTQIPNPNYPTSPLSDYSNYNTPGYNAVSGYYNSDIWGTWFFYDCSCPGFQYQDYDLVFKRWLTTPMMNFYLSYIPNHISSNIPAGKTFYDFHIGDEFPLCFPTPPSQTGCVGSNPYSEYTLKERYVYNVTSGDYIRTRYSFFVGIFWF